MNNGMLNVPEFKSLLDHLRLSESNKDKTIAQNNVFVEGCSLLCLESVKIHETSTNHMRAAQILPGQVYHQAYLPG